jgi:AcrR family transcriptional regulator
MDMPRSAEENDRIRTESRARILATALRLFARHGYEQTSIRMIAQAAGIAQGLLYNYFAGKEELLLALFEQSIADVMESFAAAETSQPNQQIEDLIRASFAIVRRNLEFWQLSYHIRMQIAVIAGLGEHLHTWTSAIHSQLETYFRDTGAEQPQIEAAILFALIDGVSQHYALDPEHYPLDAVAEALIARYRN